MKKITFDRVFTDVKVPFLNKNCTLEEYFYFLNPENEKEIREFYELDDTEQVTKTETFTYKTAFVLSNDEYNTLSNTLMNDYNFLDGVECGAYEMSDGSYIWAGVLIMTEDGKRRIFVDTEGYNYCRYVFF